VYLNIRRVSEKDFLRFVAETLGVADEKITLDARWTYDLMLDSIDRLDLLMQTEYFLSIEITDEVMQGFKTVGDLVTYLRGRGHIKD